MNLSDLHGTYNRIYSSRDIESACKRRHEFQKIYIEGKENVIAQSILLAIGYDINKLHHKIIAKRTGTHLFVLKKVA